MFTNKEKMDELQNEYWSLGEYVDFTVVTEEGEECLVRLVERKVENKKDMTILKEKVLFDSFNRLVNQDKENKSIEDLKKMYTVVLVDGTCFDGDEYYHYCTFRNAETGEPLPNCLINNIFIELSKLDRLESKEVKQWTELEQICYMMKYGHEETKKLIIDQLVECNPIINMMKQRREEYIVEWLRKIISAAK